MESKWLMIMAITVIVSFICCDTIVKTQQEKTKQIEMQFKIEMIKAGITNVMEIKDEK